MLFHFSCISVRGILFWSPETYRSLKVGMVRREKHFVTELTPLVTLQESMPLVILQESTPLLAADKRRGLGCIASVLRGCRPLSVRHVTMHERP